MIKKIGICGNFGEDEKTGNGQAIKTILIKNQLIKFFGSSEVEMLNTYEWAKRPHIVFFKFFKLFFYCKNILLLPAHKGVKVFVPLAVIWNLFFQRKIHYIVIGGWLGQFLKNNKWLLSFLKRIDVIFAETHILIADLKQLSLVNTKRLLNFKDLNILQKTELDCKIKPPYKLCIFSRIIREKGIEDAAKVIEKINKKYGKIYLLDIYGEVGADFESDFRKILKVYKDFVYYKGVADYNKSAELLSSYFLLLFPTRFFTEGIPGTIIDAYSAALPVLSSEWRAAREIIHEGKTGFIYKFKNLEDLEEKLLSVYHNPRQIVEMKKNCIQEAQSYKAEVVIQSLIEELQ